MMKKKYIEINEVAAHEQWEETCCQDISYDMGKGPLKH
jgi:hypothetical protein